MATPPILQSIEEQLGFSLQPVDDHNPAELMKHRSRNTYALNEDGELIGLNLRTNELTDDQIAFLPKLTHLQALNLSENKIGRINFPADVTSLKYLDLSENPNLREVTIEGELPDLEKLDLNESGVQRLTLPAGCQNLQLLDLRKNGLEEITFEGGCPAMTLLDLSENKLTTLTLPRGFNDLTYLYLNDNQLVELTFKSNLSKLKTLHLRNNQLKKLPDGLVNMGELEALYLHGNPLPELPKAVLPENERENSVDKVRDYLRELRKGKKINDRVKMIIVGNGRVGKTSLFRRLKGEPFNPREKYTHGVELGLLEKKHLPEVKTNTLQVNVWDFGGQEIFYATHQFFLSEDALYVLAWTDEQNVEPYRLRDKEVLPFDEKWRPPEYWLESVRLHGRESPVLMVQTHVDQHKTSINAPEYEAAPYHAECLDFSAARDYGLPLLKDKIARKLNEDISLFGEEFPETYDNVIDGIESERTIKPVISLGEFNGLCNKAGITKGSEASVLDYLRKTGSVVYFGGDDKPLLREVVYINPDWLTRQVYRLINKKLRTRKGRIDREYLIGILPEYSEKERARFVELLKSFELIFESGDEEGVYIAPQYLPDKLDTGEKKLYNIIFKSLNPAFVFHFPKFVPDNVMINFLSRYGPFSENMYWQNGICFVDQEGVQCIVEFEEENQSLFVYTQNSQRSRRLQREILNAFVELSKNANAEISLDGKQFVSWQRLVRNYEDEINKIRTTDGAATLEVEDFARFLEKGEMHVAGLKERSAGRSTGKKVFFSYSKVDREFLEQLKKQLSPLRRTLGLQSWDDQDIKAGEDWDAEIKQQLGSADIILLLVSPDFLDTEYIWEVEIKEAMARSDRGEVTVIPIIIRSCYWQGLSFGKLNGLPAKGKPVSTFEDRDTAWLEVVTGIKDVLESEKV